MMFDSGDISEQAVNEGGPRISGFVGTHSTSSNDGRGPFQWKVPCAYDSELVVAGFVENFELICTVMFLMRHVSCG